MQKRGCCIILPCGCLLPTVTVLAGGVVALIGRLF
ncbi:MAG: hypothetical protein JWN98_1355 [Abditibacteriota bacterium]|nr:hypothetical protein [Abditibacteriota bacterium]